MSGEGPLYSRSISVVYRLYFRCSPVVRRLFIRCTYVSRSSLEAKHGERVRREGTGRGAAFKVVAPFALDGLDVIRLAGGVDGLPIARQDGGVGRWFAAH